MNRTVLLLALLLTACATPSQRFSESQAYCADNANAATYGSCVEDQLNQRVPNWRKDKHAGYVSTYFSWLKAAGARVKKGEMTEDQFWDGSSQLYARLNQQATAEQQTRQSGSLDAFLMGLAIMSYGNQPTYVNPLPQPMTPITCHDFGNGMVKCF